jgi:hypothetical protein
VTVVAARSAWLTRSADLVRLAIICSVAAFLAAGDGAAALKAALVMVPSVGARLVRVHPALDLLFALALAAEAVVGGGGDDTLPHVALPLLSGPVLYTGLLRLGAVAEVHDSPRALFAAALVTVACVMALGAAWELVEWGADGALGTDYSQGTDDTRVDLLNDLIGAAGGGALVVLWLRVDPQRRLQ